MRADASAEPYAEQVAVERTGSPQQQAAPASPHLDGAAAVDAVQGVALPRDEYPAPPAGAAFGARKIGEDPADGGIDGCVQEPFGVVDHDEYGSWCSRHRREQFVIGVEDPEHARHAGQFSHG